MRGACERRNLRVSRFTHSRTLADSTPITVATCGQWPPGVDYSEALSRSSAKARAPFNRSITSSESLPILRSRRTVGRDPNPWTLATDSRSRNGSRGSGTSYGLFLRGVVRGTYRTRDRGGLGSRRDTMTTGRVFAASPRSANQISPGWWLIEQVKDLLFGGARARDIKDVLIAELYNLSDALSGLCRCLRLPLTQSSVQFFRQGVHDGLLPSPLV
jgi:hypothetical protein